MYGTFCPCARRILFCIRLSESSTSTNRRPAARSSAGELPAGVHVAVGDRDDDGLHRRDPQRERSREVLHEDADEPLERAVDRAVDGHRPLRLAVLVDVGEVEPLRQHHEVHLDRRHLPLAAQRVVDVDVDLGRVERPVLRLGDVVAAGAVERLPDQPLGQVPQRGVADAPCPAWWRTRSAGSRPNQPNASRTSPSSASISSVSWSGRT